MHVCMYVFIYTADRPKPSVEHKNLIIMIGDGFGPASVTMGRTCKGAPLNLDSYQTGMIRTRSSQSYVALGVSGLLSCCLIVSL